MKLFIFTTLLLILCTHLSLCQINKSKTVEKFEQNADTLFKTFKYDSASVYYCKAARLYETKQDWLHCVKNYRLTSNALLKAAKYDTALYFTLKAKTITETRFQENHKEQMFEKSDVLLNMADVYEKKGKYNEGLVYCKKALSLIIKTDSSSMHRIANVWNKTGFEYCILAKYDSSLYYCEKALSVIKKTLGETHIDVSECYFTMGVIFNKKNNFDRSLEYLQKALQIRTATYGKEHPDVGSCYSAIGNVYLVTEDYDRSLTNYEKAKNIQTSIYGENHPNVADNYNAIGIIYIHLGNYNKALENSQKALKIRVSILGENHPEVAKSYNNIGAIYDDKGNYDKALEFYQKALKTLISVYGQNHPLVAACYSNIGIVYKEKSDYDKALEFYQKDLKILISVYGQNHPALADCYNNIGTFYNKKNDYDKAMEFYQKALHISISTYGENHPKMILPYTNIANIYDIKGNTDKALELLQKALQISISTYEENHPQVARNYHNIAEIYEEKSEYNRALEFYQKALQISISVYGENHADVVLTNKHIGDHFNKKGEIYKALHFYQKAINANIYGFVDTSVYTNPRLEKILSEPLLLNTLTAKANAFYLLSRNNENPTRDMEASLSTYELAFQLINKMRKEYNIENTKLLLSDDTKNYYSQALHMTLKFDSTLLSQEYRQKPFEFIEKGKSATLAARFNESMALHFAGIPDSLLLLEKEFRSNIGFYATQITNQKYQKGGYDTLKVNALENENFTCSRKLDSLISYFETTYPAYYELKYANKIDSISEIQKSLDNNTAILDYFVGDSSLFIATITDRLYKIEEIPIDSSFKKQITSYYSNIKKVETQLFVSNSIFIYEKLIKPISNYISGKKHLVIIPDDYLYYLPFETLIDNTTSPKVTVEDYSKLNYLIKSHSISYHHSASLWNHQKKIEGDHTINFVGFAPVFSKDTNNGLILSSNINAMDTAGNSLAYRSITPDMKRFTPLPCSKDEVTSIVHLFEKKKKEAKAHIYSEANEANFKSNSENYSIVHVSSHGFSNDKEPGLSGIVFSQPTDTLDKEDGILYTSETYNLSLHADLIVLSSCESGLGKLIKGEGLQALSRGFLYAGTPNIIFSLWKAMDKPTKDLMVQFYSNVLNGKSYDESLRLAKLKLINDPNTAFPLYWSGFVLIGK